MSQSLNIAFFASSLVSAYWNGAATYYRGIVRALYERGHHITFYEPDAFERQSHRDIPDPDWARVVVYPGQGEAGVVACLQEAKSADIIIKASGVGVFDSLLEATIIELRRPGHAVIFWDVDAPATLERVQNNPLDPFAALIPQYDMILTYGGGDPVVKAYKALGARECVPIYNALDTSTHYPVEPDPKFSADLAFLGNRLPDREARVEEFFLRPAAALSDRSFLLGGSGWADKSMPANVNYVGHVYTADHNAFNCTPKAVLNIARDSMARCGFSPATRVFEAAGARACIITDEWEGIELFLEPNKEILIARDGQEVAEHLRSLTPHRASAIGDAAFKRICSEHTYAHRARQVESLLLDSEVSTLIAVGAPTQPEPQPSQGMNIVILGLSITSSWGNGHATTFRGLVRGLDARGHNVLFLERDVPWYAENRDLPNPPFGRTELYASLSDLKDRFAADVRNADLVIVGSYVPEGIEVGKWVTSIAGGMTAFYDIDTPITLANLENNRAEYLSADLIPRYSLYLSFTGGPILDRLERRHGSPMARALYCSFDPDLYYPERHDEAWDLGYLGTYSADRQPVLNRLMLEPARRWTEGRFVAAGPQYPSSIEWPSNVKRIEHLSPAQHRAFYSSQRFTLNVTRAEMSRVGFSPSVRLFEAAACATPIISDWWEGLDTILEPGSEVLVSRSYGDSLRYLRETSDEQRRAIGERARARVLAEHTADHRAAELEECALRLMHRSLANRSV